LFPPALSSQQSTSNCLARRSKPALGGFLAGYSGLTRDAYSLDLRMYTAWVCVQHGPHLFAARRADIECFGRNLETAGRARATIARRLKVHQLSCEGQRHRKDVAQTSLAAASWPATLDA